MLELDRKRALAAFAHYVDGYDSSDPKVRLKIEHTYRVASLAQRIARSLSLPSADVDLAWLCGLVHDVGRFEQLRRYGTFFDAASVSHAQVGVDVLFGEGRIRDYLDDPSEDQLIRTVVAEHSDYRLPDDLDERTRRFATILRDADKLDILRVNCTFTCEDIYDVPEGEMRASTLSPSVVETFYEHHTILRREKRTPADLLVGHAAFVFELVWPESLRIACEQGYAVRMLSRTFDQPQTQESFDAMRKHLVEWMDERLAAEGPASS